MKWKLRIPMITFCFSPVFGIYLYIENLLNEGVILGGLLPISVLAFIVYLLENKQINERKVHFSLGLLLIVVGLLFNGSVSYIVS